MSIVAYVVQHLFNMKRLTGYVTPNSNGRPTMTAKAIRATIWEIDGETAHVDTLWIPRSLAKGGRVYKETTEGATAWAFECDMPSWWVAKLDDRPGWAKRGEQCPMGQRPW